jgi:hypothetical protein
MRLLGFLVLVVFVAIVGRLVVRTLSVESTGEKLRITIDKRKLKETGREAADKVGAALEKAARMLDSGRDERDTRK